MTDVSNATLLALLERIDQRLEKLEGRVNTLSTVIEQTGPTVAGLVDTVDDGVRRLETRGVDVDQRLHDAVGLLERLTAPDTTERLGRLLERLDTVEAAADLAAQAPAMLATFTDVVDAAVAAAQEQDVDVDQRVGAAVSLLGQLTEPDVLDAISVLADELPRLAPIVEGLPHTVATTVDIIDDFMARQLAQGVDVEAIFTNMVMVATQVSNILHTPEFGALMESGVLAPRTLEVIGKAGQALADTQHNNIPKVGLLGALRAAGQPDVQRALGFALTFAEKFGQNMESTARRALAAKN